MADHIAGFPYWDLGFDETGGIPQAAQKQAILDDARGLAVTDLFLFSHGWNNDRAMAYSMYAQFLQLFRALIDNPNIPKRKPAKIGLVGVMWPARMWADESIPGVTAGGAAALKVSPSNAELVLDLKALFSAPEQQTALDEMARLLTEQPSDPQDLVRFHDLMQTLDAGAEGNLAPEDNGEQRGLMKQDPIAVYKRFASVMPPAHRHGGAAGLGNPISWLWNGAKEALREATYWQMKKRAGTVGENGLGPLLGDIAEAAPSVRIHLLGHSFGSRLVSFAIKGLPGKFQKAPTPIKSVVLLQAAFSHFAFADSVPQSPGTPGALAGMLQRIDGPLVATHSVHDMAVGWLYPMASMISGDNASAFKDELFQWGAIGHDGVQSAKAVDVQMSAAGHSYTFASGSATNLNGDAIIIQGGPPSGAHGDIFHPQVAWAALVAAGIGGQA